MNTQEVVATLQPGDGQAERIAVDTTRGSLIHWLIRRRPDGRPISTGATAFLVVALGAYVPIVIAAWLGGLPLLHPTDAVHLPLFYDTNTAWMCLVSLPTLLVLTVRDQRALDEALSRAQDDGVIRAHEGAAEQLKAKYEKVFLRLNVFSQVLGLAAGIALAAANYSVMRNPKLAPWGSPSGVIQPAGYYMLAVVVVLYALVTIYIFRSAGFVAFLRGMVKKSDVDMLPLHPDACGGLRPMGDLGLRNQYVLTVFGINLIFLAYVTQTYLGDLGLMQFLVALGAAAYLILGPLVFLGPLLPFRGGMLDAKRRLLRPVAERLRLELSKVEGNLAGGVISKQDEELIDRLQKLGTMIDSLPVWPFDAGTLRRFLTAYVLPVAGAIGLPLIDMLIRARLHVP